MVFYGKGDKNMIFVFLLWRQNYYYLKKTKNKEIGFYAKVQFNTVVYNK